MPSLGSPTPPVSRTLFVGLAMIETMAIYALVIALLVLFANPFVK
jgi:F-type H+-transporting ATPase subunit c